MLYDLYCLIIVLVTLNGTVSPITPASYTTYASAWVLVVFPQLSPLIYCYYSIPLPNPYALGQQVNIYYSLTSVLFGDSIV